MDFWDSVFAASRRATHHYVEKLAHQSDLHGESGADCADRNVFDTFAFTARRPDWAEHGRDGPMDKVAQQRYLGRVIVNNAKRQARCRAMRKATADVESMVCEKTGECLELADPVDTEQRLQCRQIVVKLERVLPPKTMEVLWGLAHTRRLADLHDPSQESRREFYRRITRLRKEVRRIVEADFR